MTAAPRRRRRDPVRIALGVFVALFFVFVLAPIVVVIVVSFNEAEFISFPVERLSLRWYHRIIEYRPFIDSLLVSLELAVASAFLACLLGVPAALAIARSHRPLAQLFATFLLAPLSMPAIVLGFALLYYLSALGFGVSFDALLVAHTVIAIPYVTRNVVAVYRAVPGDLEEAAAILGAGRWQTFRHVTLPMIKPGIFAGSLFAILISLDNLPISFFFGTSSTNTLPVVMLSYLQNQFDPSVAAICTVQMVIAVVALLVMERVGGLRQASL